MERQDFNMRALYRSERIKARHSFIAFLPLSAAALQVMISLFLSMGTSYYSVNAWNWWYTIILPGMLSVLCYLGIRKEKKQYYANMLTTQIAPEKCWIGKILYHATKLLSANLLIFAGTAVGGVLTETAIPVVNGLVAALILSICYLWEIPLYMVLSARFGMFAAVFTCMTITIGSLVTLGASKLWWICPASVPFRLMCPVLQIMPNGLIVESGSSYMSTSVILPGIMISLLWFAALTFVTARWFRRTV